MLAYEPHYESANDLVNNWKSSYRYGFPDFLAYGPPVRPMDFDFSKVYSGVVGRHYPDAQTGRYHYMYDPNLAVEPMRYGLGQTAGSDTATKIGGVVLGLVGIGVGIGSVLWARRASTRASARR